MSVKKSSAIQYDYAIISFSIKQDKHNLLNENTYSSLLRIVDKKFSILDIKILYLFVTIKFNPNSNFHFHLNLIQLILFIS